MCVFVCVCVYVWVCVRVCVCVCVFSLFRYLLSIQNKAINEILADVFIHFGTFVCSDVLEKSKLFANAYNFLFPVRSIPQLFD